MNAPANLANATLMAAHVGASPKTTDRILVGLAHPTLPKLFRQRVRRGSDVECWPWDGMINEKGYGRFQLRTGVTIAAHRIAYYAHYGRWPGSLVVCHRCDNPVCCNPAHLFLGTHTENMADCSAKGRTYRPAGELAARSKLTAAQVIDMRGRYRPGRNGGCNTAAAEFGISSSAASSILLRKTWRHI